MLSLMRPFYNLRNIEETLIFMIFVVNFRNRYTVRDEIPESTEVQTI